MSFEKIDLTPDEIIGWDYYDLISHLEESYAEIDRLNEIAKGVDNLNWKLSGHVDMGGGIPALQKWIECLEIDSKNKGYGK